MLRKSEKINALYVKVVGRDSSVGIATRYGLKSPGIKSRWGEIFCTRPDLPWGHTQAPMQRAPGVSRGKAAGSWC
jgi:hypothetical protein